MRRKDGRSNKPGQGRPTPHPGKRINIYLSGDNIDYIGRLAEGKRSEWINQAVRNERKNEMSTKEERARYRIGKGGFTQAQQDFIFADWPNWSEHIEWLLTASKQDILSWIKASKADLGSRYATEAE
jgi:hypothetical protein